VLAVTFRNKLCWFESHYRHISLCSPGSWTHASSSLWKQILLAWVPLSAHFFMCVFKIWLQMMMVMKTKMCMFY